MNPLFTATNNRLVEKARMEHYNSIFWQDHEESQYSNYRDKYYDHLASLRSYSATFPLEEGKDYELGKDFEASFEGCAKGNDRCQCRSVPNLFCPDSYWVAIPVEQQDKQGEHELKIWPQYFDDVNSGKKNFEVRKMDRLFGVGDILWLREWSPIKGYTGRETRKQVTYLMTGGQWGLSENNCIMGIASPTPPVQGVIIMAEAYANKVHPFVWPKNKHGEDMVQVAGASQPPFSKRHRREQNKLMDAFIAGFQAAQSPLSGEGQEELWQEISKLMVNTKHRLDVSKSDVAVFVVDIPKVIAALTQSFTIQRK